MKSVRVYVVAAALASLSHLAAQTPAKPANAPTKPKQTKPTGKTNPDTSKKQSSALPAGAQQVSPYEWKYTDEQGKKWMYRQTPFGLNKYPDTPEPAAPKEGQWTVRETPFGKVKVQERAAPPAPDQPVPVQVKDLGDSFEFRRQMPFGEQKWTRKKSDLDDSERELLKAAQSQKTSELQKSATSAAEKK